MNSWTSITTTNSSFWQTIGHAQHIRELGGAPPIYFIDQPEKLKVDQIGELEKVANVVVCDARYWGGLGGRPERLPRRQFINLQIGRKMAQSRWILHLDTDEFVMTSLNIENLLDSLPPETNEVRLQNCERIVRSNEGMWYDGVLRMPCYRMDILENYQEFVRPFLGMGLAGYYHGKSFVRNRPHLLQGIHGGFRKEAREIVSYKMDIKDIGLIHFQFMGMVSFTERLHSIRSRLAFKEAHITRQFEFLDKNKWEESSIRKLSEALFFIDGQVEENCYRHGLYAKVPKTFLSLMHDIFNGNRNLR